MFFASAIYKTRKISRKEKKKSWQFYDITLIMLAYLFLSKVATLTQAINSQTFPYMNFCIRDVKAVFTGISVSICDRWLVNRKPEEYFLNRLITA